MPVYSADNEVQIDIGPSVLEGWTFRAVIVALLIYAVYPVGLTLSVVAALAFLLAVLFATPGPKLPKEVYLKAGCLHVGDRVYGVTECKYSVWGFDNVVVWHGGRVVVFIYKVGRGYRDAVSYLSERGVFDPETEERLVWKPTGT